MESHFGPSHFSQTGCDAVSRPVQEVSFVCLLRLCKSWLHAAQGMEFVASSRRLVRGHSGASTSFRAVVAPTERERQRCGTLSSSTWSLAHSRPRHKSPSTDPSRPAHTSFARRGRNRRLGESSEVGTGFRARVPGAPELSEEGQSRGKMPSSWGPAGTVSEVRRTIGEACESSPGCWRKRNNVSHVCVPSWLRRAHTTPHLRFQQTMHRNWFS